MSRRVGTVVFLFWSQLAGLVLAGGWVAISGSQLPPVATLAAAAGAGLSITVGLGALFQAMVVGAISVVAPISATGVVVPVFVGIGRGEHPNLPQVIGIVATIVGMVLAVRGSGPEWHARSRSGLVLALLAALGAGVWFWLMASASRHGVDWAVLIGRAVTFLILSATVAVKRTSPRPAVPWKSGSTILTASLMSFLAVTLYGLATLHGKLAIVSVLGSLFPAVTVLLAYRVLGERLRWVQQLGVALVLAGVALLSV